ncbi:MAG: hypothetical protein QOG71_3065 [Pyrinomonadaceae bacterium]|nr:hypothetical protein [Pyrinomonadaceae bacterium]
MDRVRARFVFEELARHELSDMEGVLRSTEERKTEAWKLPGLNDRFSLLRRAEMLLKTYSHRAAVHPTVARLYSKGRTRADRPTVED